MEHKHPEESSSSSRKWPKILTNSARIPGNSGSSSQRNDSSALELPGLAHGFDHSRAAWQLSMKGYVCVCERSLSYPANTLLTPLSLIQTRKLLSLKAKILLSIHRSR